MKDTITRLQNYQGSLVHVTSINKFWNEATIYFVCPVGKQQTGTFKVGLPRRDSTVALVNRNTSVVLDKKCCLLYIVDKPN